MAMTREEMYNHPVIRELLRQFYQAEPRHYRERACVRKDGDAVILPWCFGGNVDYVALMPNPDGSWRILHDEAEVPCPYSPRLTGAPGDYNRLVQHLVFPQ